jgi:hypothetical protein
MKLVSNTTQEGTWDQYYNVIRFGSVIIPERVETFAQIVSSRQVSLGSSVLRADSMTNNLSTLMLSRCDCWATVSLNACFTQRGWDTAVAVGEILALGISAALLIETYSGLHIGLKGKQYSQSNIA